MIEVKITGDNPLAVFQQMASLVSIANAAAQKIRADVAAPQSRPTATEAADAFPKSDDVGAAEPGPNPSVAAGPTPARRGRKPKAQTIEAQAEPTPTADTMTADFLDDESAAPKAWTEADCRGAVRQALQNFEIRAREAHPNYANLKGAARDEVEKKIMADKVAYVMPLLTGFGVKQVSALKPEDYAAFMQKAPAYIDGAA